MTAYAVYVNGRFIKHFPTHYRALNFVSSCLSVMHVLGIHDFDQSDFFDVKEEEI